MIVVGARLGDHVDRRAFRASVHRREALRADLEFLNCFQGKLHHRSTHRIVFVIHTIDGDVDVAAPVSVHGENCIAVFCRVVGVGGLHSRGEISEIGDVPSDHRKLFDLFGRNVLAYVRLRLVYKRDGFAGDLNELACRARLQLGVDRCRLAHQDFDGLDDGSKSRLVDGYGIGACGQ